MIKILTFAIIPYFRLGLNTDPYLKPGTEWVRDAVKGMMHQNDRLLKSRNVDTSLFHNHDEQSSQNKPTYPKIIYHFANARFMVTGINEGAYALEQLMLLYNHPVEAGRELVISFRRLRIKEEFNITNSEKPITYQLINYLPFNVKVHKQYETLTAQQKIGLLEETITKHLVNDLFKYLSIPEMNLHIQLLDILKLDQKRHTYKNHQYFSFDLLFEMNVTLPDLLTLGNGKAFGFGLLEKVTKPDLL